MLRETIAAKFDESVGQLKEVADKLSASIQAGDKQKAQAFLEELLDAQPKVNVSVSVPISDNRQRIQENDFSVRVHVEDREAAGGVFMMKVRSCDTIFDLKKKFLLQYDLPIEVQRWIIGKCIRDDTCSLYSCGVKGPGATLYLYIVTAHSVGLTREAFEANRRAYAEGRFPLPMNPQLSTSSDGSLLASTFGTGAGKPSSPGLNFQFSDGHFVPENNEKSNAFMTSSWTSHDSKDIGLGYPEPSRSPNGASVIAPAILPSLLPRESRDSGIDSSECAPVVIGHVPATSIVTSTAPQTSVLDEEPEMIGWDCPTCTYRNLPTRPGCAMCSTSRPESYEIPAGYQMTQDELIRKAVDDEMERKTREEEAMTLRENFDNWLMADMMDLIENKESFTCPICFDEIEPRNGIVLRECLHTFCRECLHDAVQHCEEAELKCPFQDDDYSCTATLQEREIRALVSESLYSKYLQRSLDEAESKAQNSYHCKTTDCHGWCLYEDDVNFFTCPVCKKKNCLTCKAIHEGMNCQEFQTSLDEKLETDNDAKQTKMLLERLLDSGSAMRCPQCQVILQKKDGCDWLKCSICKLEICWVTKGPRWGPSGHGDETGGCRCRIGGKKCHTDCINCH